MDSKNFLFLLPFVCFFAGYQVLNMFFAVDKIPTPTVIGASLTTALKILSSTNLNARILAEQEDKTLPEGSILSQVPEPNTLIKPQQPVFLVIAKNPPKRILPSYRGLTESEVRTRAKALGLRIKAYNLTTIYPIGECIAQYPLPGTPIDSSEENTILAYFSASNHSPVIVPQYKGHTLAEALASVPSCVKVVVRHRNCEKEYTSCTTCRIIEQKPYPGALVYLQRPVTLQLITTPAA